MNQPVRQHTVPMILLRYFADNDEKLYLYRANSRKVTLERVENISVVNNFYTFKDENGENSYKFEELMGQSFEPQYKDAYEIIQDTSWELVGLPRDMVGTLIALQQLRVPKQRKKIEDYLVAKFRNSLINKEPLDFENTPLTEEVTFNGENISLEELYELNVDLSELHIELDSSSIHTGYLIGNIWSVGEEYAKKKFTYVKTNSNKKFITSDNPVIEISKDILRFLDEEALFMPLDNYTGILISGYGEDEYKNLLGSDVTKINRLMAKNSDRLITSSNKDLLLALSKYMN